MVKTLPIAVKAIDGTIGENYVFALKTIKESYDFDPNMSCH